jgi:hypothetical protein
MYANTCWGFLGLAVTFGLAVLGLPIQYEWLSPWFLGAAVACGVGSIICFGWPLRQRDNRVKVAALITHPLRALKLIEPSHVIILGLVIALGGVIWQLRSAPRATTELTGPQVVINSPQIAAPPMTGPARLVANDVPTVPTDIAKKIGRYWQLKDAIIRAKNIALQIETSGTAMRDRMNPHIPNVPTRGPTDVLGWTAGQQNLRQINDMIYKNRPLDLASVPELAIPTMKAPDESAFKEDEGEALYKYRAFHFLVKNVVKQANQLVSEMETEAERIRTNISTTQWMDGLDK